jgi:superfamily I DNA/RNA helicase
LLTELSRFFDPNWAFPPMLQSQIDLLRCMIHPEIRLSAPEILRPGPQQITYEPRSESSRLTEISPTTGIRFRTYRLASANSASSVAELSAAQTAQPQLTISDIILKALDLQQELAARSVGSGHRLIFGVAGSGKTVVLISRARLLAVVAQKRVLILCFNVTLCSFLAKSLEDVTDRVTVRHFDGFASEFNVRRQHRQSHAKLGERLLQRLQEDKVEPVYDALLIDEAQDFDPSWFICAMQLVRNSQEADVLIVGDGNQGIYGRRRTPWSSLGIRAKGRTTYFRKSYRSSKEIIRFAAPFASTEAQEDDGVSPIAIDPAQATRSSGILPVLMRAANRQGETENVVELVGSLINGRLVNQQLAQALHPSDIAVLIPAITEELNPIFRQLCNQLDQRQMPYLWLSNPDDRKARTRISENRVKLQSIHSSKGLQYRAVITLWTDLLPNTAWTESEDEQRMLFYVALTRAEDYLIVSYSGESPFLAILMNSGNAQLLGG